MLISDVKKIIEKYDENKGFGRTYLKEEPHIGELRTFVDTLPGDDRELNAAELLSLAKIILGKNTSNQSESSKVFQKLTVFFGGIEALAALNQEGQLSKMRCAFLEKHKEFARQFSDTMLFLSSKIEENVLDLLLNPLCKMKNPDNLPEIIKLIETRAIQPGMVFFIHALCSACKLGLYTDEVVNALSTAKDIEVISKTLSLIETSDLTSLDNDRLFAILKLQNPALFYKLLIHFEVSAQHIDVLCGVEYQLKQRITAAVNDEEFFAVEIATVLIALYKAGCFSAQTCEAMLQYPECFAMNVKLIKYLAENDLQSESNFITIGSLKLHDDHFLAILDQINTAGLLNQQNLLALIEKTAYLKTLLSAVRCLANGGQLFQASYDDIIQNPLLALSLAETYGGQPYPKSEPCLVDVGAQDFVEIRKNARILAQGQHSLFASATMREDATFREARGMSIHEAKHASLLKIAEFCGDGALEQETEANIAALSFYSV